MARKRQALTPADVIDRATRLIRFWQARDIRFNLEQSTYELEPPVEDPRHELVMLNDPYVVVEKMANILGGARILLRVVPKGTTAKEAELAEKMEHLIKYLWRRAEARWYEMLHGPLQREEAHFLLLRGWCVSRILLDPTPEGDFDIRVDLLDPATVYPQPGPGGIAYVITRSWQTVGELRAEFGDVLKGFREDEEVEVYGYYDDQHLMVVTAQGAVVKPLTRHGYGFCPVVITVAYGPPYRGSQTLAGRFRWQRHVGHSILTGMIPNYRRLVRLVSIMDSIISRNANPPILIKTRDGQAVDVDFSPGSKIYLDKEGEDLAPIPPVPSWPDLRAQLQLLEARVQRATLPPVTFGDVGAALSGYAISILANAARDAIWPWVMALQSHRVRLSQHMLRLYKQFGTKMRVPSKRLGYWYDLKPGDVDPDALIEVEYVVRPLQDKAALAQLARLLTQPPLPLISIRRAMREFLDIDDEETESERILGDLIRLDQGMLKYLVKRALEHMGAPEAALIQAPEPPGPPPQPPGVSAPGGTPAKGPKVGLKEGENPPPHVVPPEATRGDDQARVLAEIEDLGAMLDRLYGRPRRP